MDSLDTLGSSKCRKEERTPMHFPTLSGWIINHEESDNINNVMDELYREAGTTLLEEPDSSMELMDTHREDEDHIRKIKEFQDYLQMVKITIKPGCSEEVLKVALNSMSSLLGILAFMSYPKHRSSL
ncbi:hypothetical protein ERO13_D06G145600v2 [Gossypium hirsutum]|uniref:Pyrophosphate--fructose 6-phosphate 1-phosphotransferase subunit alpha isoform X1 n=5 Tax=Gossypium TaxID=3633 RepID=A0A1U8J4D5_GOSHI|nr:pyrophosphate--fructose 6-phosphate 1-phosphotransferase subunit alpha isoform X1 [Gossypium hirsutum]KAB2025761.1 hypothetical protein ES319_D06G171200v1 [Gossypium barbadense]KAG4142705.1 hypothetical protein ERO13_D06G145600v2 [Gossypium hirsutum]TYG65401.1 hypothetical protein ES288_D06G182600v1 [Gossypium darwinii]TYH67379.1 hypothetical protein ES332_D06G184400v1 [Gossypium tomentosum]